MTRQNRVMPDGEIVVDSARGTLMGNRGVLHDGYGAIRRRYGPMRAWVTCLLEFKGRRRSLMQPGRYTELFFLDEAVALAAGHRPCGECRRAAFRAFRSAWDAGNGTTAALEDLDRAMQVDRIDADTRQPKRHLASIDNLPDGAFVLHDGTAHLVRHDALLPFEMSGYKAPVRRPTGVSISVLTPAVTVAALKAGYPCLLHRSAG